MPAPAISDMSAQSIGGGSTVSTKASTTTGTDSTQLQRISLAGTSALASPSEGIHAAPPAPATERSNVALPAYVFKEILKALQERDFQRFVMRWAFRNCEDFPVGKDGI